MDEGTIFLKVRDLVERTGLSEADVRRSLRTFGEFLASKKQGRGRVYAPETADQLNQIAELEAMGTTVATIRGILRGGKAMAEAAGDPASAMGGGSIATAGENLTLGVLSDVKNLQEELRDLREQVASLREKVSEHEQKVIGHQQQLRLLRHDMDEQRTDALARRMEERNAPFWRRLFR